MITGEDTPKQFCQLYGGRTLLAHTRFRLAAAIAPEHTVFAVVKPHERYYTKELADVKPSRVVVQPSNKGTTAAIVHSLDRIRSLAGDPVVGFFPTDHLYEREPQFVASVRLAFKIASSRPQTIILLGARAEYPEVEYGWIEPGTPLACRLTDSLLGVRQFWEKPSTQVAQALLACDCLWNTFVMIGRASAFLDILKASVPRMLQAITSGDGDPRNREAESGWANSDQEFAAIAPGDFSQQVLSVSTNRLAVLRLKEIGWSDLGTPERVRRALTRHGLRWDHDAFAQNESVGGLASMAAS
jgi:mannose-1-phosphate guanylyltransferase